MEAVVILAAKYRLLLTQEDLGELKIKSSTGLPDSPTTLSARHMQFWAVSQKISMSAFQPRSLQDADGGGGQGGLQSRGRVGKNLNMRNYFLVW